jgi:hypothetical protein
MEILKKYFIVIFITQIAALACVKKANLKLPDPEEKLVVVCFISPDNTEVMASVKTSQPQYGKFDTIPNPNFDNVKNASVVISDGALNFELKYDANLQIYSAKLKTFKIEAGKTYYLAVKTPDGKLVDASTKVPLNKLIIQSYDVTVKKMDSSFQTNTKITINDIPNETNYVAVYPQSLVIDKFFTDSTVTTEDTITSNFWLSYFDSDFNTSKTNYSFEYSIFVFANKSSNIGIRTYVLNCSFDFYQYNKSLINAANSGFGNPFAQPALVYSNINNGFGCFGAYNPTIIFKRLN